MPFIEFRTKITPLLFVTSSSLVLAFLLSDLLVGALSRFNMFKQRCVCDLFLRFVYLSLQILRLQRQLRHARVIIGK